MIKAIIFDCFGVLTTDTWKEFTATLPKDQTEEASELNRAYGAGILTHAEFLQAIEDLTGHAGSEVESLLDHENSKNEELLQYIKELKTSYRIGLLSNIATNWVREEFLTPEEQSLFDAMVFSYEVGAAKPDLRIYEVMVERLALQPAECVFIDDSEGHCTAASEMGMKTIWYKNLLQTQNELNKILDDSER